MYRSISPICVNNNPFQNPIKIRLYNILIFRYNIMANAWVEHVKEFARIKGIPYGCAISDPECKKSYDKPKKAKKPRKSKKQEEAPM